MCGIAGFFREGNLRDESATLLEAMGNAIRHRGPDASGQYVDDCIALVHRRLSIIDLTESGAQPMTSQSGRFVIVFNGEIYNYRDLRKNLQNEGFKFIGHSDTEVLIALYEKHGTACLEMLNGMFAMAIWDKQEQSLFLCRDRLGKKPLYFYKKDNSFSFASELKALLKIPGIDKTIRMDALRDYFNYQYVPDPKTIFSHVHKLKPGHWIRFRDNTITEHQYWDVSFSSVDKRSKSNIKDDLYNLLEDSVRLRMISDVPLGAFLSGGVDSSAVVGLMSSISKTPVTTCAIGFNSEKYDEVKFADAVAKQFETDHHEFTVRDNVAEQLINIASCFDEPFSDPSFVPTYFVSQLARKKVTVALAGDGGDENFAGYTKYLTDQTENRIRSLLPGQIRRLVFPATHRALQNTSNALLSRMGSLAGTLSVEADTGFAISNSFFDPATWQDLATDSTLTALSGYDPLDITRDAYQQADSDVHLSKIQYADIKTYLPGDILVKVDRMSMINSLETRAPILDYRLVEYAATIPASFKLNGRETKHILKESMKKILTDDTLYRKKMGFSVPLAQWLREEIKPVVHQYLFKENSGLSQFFKTSSLTRIWDTHQSGQRNYAPELWSLFMFEVWWQTYMTDA